jgi:Zn-dependent peptidase ImmA (M78 family)
MKPNDKFSVLAAVLDGFTLFWSPAGEALSLQKELKIKSLDQTANAAQRAGFEICYVDLPQKVSGFAEIIDGRRYIVLNRNKTQRNLEYTLPHELGHHVLHLSASGNCAPPVPSDISAAEFQADLFAVVWLTWLADDIQREQILAENPESIATVAKCLLLTLILMVVVVLFSVCSNAAASNRLLPSGEK